MEAEETGGGGMAESGDDGIDGSSADLTTADLAAADEPSAVSSDPAAASSSATTPPPSPGEEAKEVKDPNGDCGKQRRWYRGGQASPLALPEPRLVGAEGSAHPWNRPSWCVAPRLHTEASKVKRFHGAAPHYFRLPPPPPPHPALGRATRQASLSNGEEYAQLRPLLAGAATVARRSSAYAGASLARSAESRWSWDASRARWRSAGGTPHSPLSLSPSPALLNTHRPSPSPLTSHPHHLPPHHSPLTTSPLTTHH